MTVGTKTGLISIRSPITRQTLRREAARVLDWRHFRRHDNPIRPVPSSRSVLGSGVDDIGTDSSSVGKENLPRVVCNSPPGPSGITAQPIVTEKTFTTPGSHGGRSLTEHPLRGDSAPVRIKIAATIIRSLTNPLPTKSSLEIPLIE